MERKVHADRQPPTHYKIDTRHFRQSPLEATRVDIRASVHVSTDTDLVAQVVHQRQSSMDPGQVPTIPATDRELWLLARRRTETGIASRVL